MPGRKHPFITSHIYHVYNRLLDENTVLGNITYIKKFKQISRYYRSSKATLRYSAFLKLSTIFKQQYLSKIKDKATFRVSILAYAIMPTHYHFLVRQNQEKGISAFISQIQNSFTRFYNIKNGRSGPIFLHRFKSKPIVTEEQCKHVARYINLNPYSSGFVKQPQLLLNDNRTSLYEYTKSIEYLCETNYLLELFSKNIDRLQQFILDQADYQKTLEMCKYSEKRSQ